MTLEEKLNRIFNDSKPIVIQSTVRRSNGEWYSRIVWKHVELPTNRSVKECEWFGFDNITDCVDNCLKYLESERK